MTQLALLLALGLIGLVLSFVLGRLEVKRGTLAPTVKRIEGAVERASVAVLRLAGLRALILLVVPALGLTACSFLVAKPSGAISAGGRAAFLSLALLAGALSTFAQARLAIALGARACSAAAALRGSARSMRPLLRACWALAGFGDGLGLLSVCLAFAALYAVRGGFAQASGSAELSAEVVRLLPAFALGAAVGALAVAREGAALATAAVVGGGHTSEREAQLEAQDPRNPASLAELLGEQVGGLLPQALASYVTGVSATVGAALLAVSLAGDPNNGEAPLTCLLLLLVVRGFGVVGSTCGVFAARADETEAPERALLRGQLSASIVATFGVGAGLYWLHVAAFAALFGAAVSGILATALVTQLVWLPLRRSAPSARETAEARSLGDGAAVARGASAGLWCLVPALLIPALALWVLERALALTGQALPSQGMLLVAFVAGLLATAPYSMAVAGFGLLSDGAQGFASLARLEADPRRAGFRLDEASAIGGGAATHASLALTASLLLGLFALYTPTLSNAHPGLGLAAVLAAVVLILAFAARTSQSALLGARAVAEEVRRQLAGLPRRQGTVAVPSDFTPSYKACVDSALASVQAGSLAAPIAALLVPFAVAAALFGELSTRMALLGFASSALICSLTFVLGSRATRLALREARRRSRGSEATGQVASSAQTFGDLLGLAAATSVEALAAAVALSVVSLTSLLG